MRRVNDGEIFAIAAAIARVPLKSGFRIDREPGHLVVIHPQTMLWSSEVRQAIQDAIAKRTGLKTMVA